MTVQNFLAPERCIILEREEKQEVIGELVAALWRSLPELDYTSIFDAIWEREVQFTTRISAEIAMPHAQIAGMKETYICVGHAIQGIAYDPKDQNRVRLIFLVVGPPEQHLKVLSTLAKFLMRESTVERLLASKSGPEIFRIMTESGDEPAAPDAEEEAPNAPPPQVQDSVDQEAVLLGLAENQVPGYRYARTAPPPEPNQDRILLDSAARIAMSLDASALFIHSEARQEVLKWYKTARILEQRDLRDLTEDHLQDDETQASSFPDLVLVESSSSLTTDSESQLAPSVRRLTLPYHSGRASPVPLAILMALSRGIIRKGQQVVSAYSSNDDELNCLEVSDIDRDFGLFFSMPFHGSSTDTQMEVFMRTLQLATELAAEGREGKPVGTVVVLGDADQVANFSQQMVVNPFRGYEPHERNILDPSLTETLKEFSRIDGAIIIRGDGVIVSAGTYLRVDRPVEDLPSGLGARHTAAAGITAVTRAVSLAISESTRQVSIFYAGSRVMVL